MKVRIHPSWELVLRECFAQPWFVELTSFVKQAYQTTTVYPLPKDIFRAFDLCPFAAVRVVILGQDPYHEPRQANGLCFSVHQGVRSPPSLQNIVKELSTDLDLPEAKSGDLTRWASQGVLLLNATLTVADGQPKSHAGKGWEQLTDAAIIALSREREHLVFLLWGAHAQSKRELIDDGKHYVLTAAHPSPYSVSGFFGCRHFSKTNAYLAQHNLASIDWHLDN